ncbi:MAG: hypothetical protein ABFS38_15845 [Bacteroidota bacterium]
MKKLYSTIIAVILLAASADAQIHLFLEEQEINLKDGKSSAWVFPVTRDLDEALNDLKEYSKDRSDVKMKKGGDNLVIAEKVSISTIATKRGDLIGYGFITDSYYAVAMVFQLGYDISVNSKEWAVEMNNFRNYAKEFMSYHYEQTYARRIKVLEKEIKSLEKQTEQNGKKINSMNKKINNLTVKISKEEDEAKSETYKGEITTLESDIQVLSDALPQLKSQIEALQGNADKLKSESHTFQTTIGSI